MRWVVIAMLAACGSEGDGKPPERVVMLNALPGIAMTIDFNESSVFAKLSFDGEVIHDGDDFFCPILDRTVTITLAGVNGRLVHAGGWGPMAGDWSCSRPFFEVAIPNSTPDDATLVVRDDSLELRYPLGNVLAPRTIDHPDWTFAAAGETATFTWSPVTDLDAGRVHVLALGISALDARVRSGAIEVPFPPQSPATGTLRFWVSFDGTCGNRCTFEAGHGAEHAAAIVP